MRVLSGKAALLASAATMLILTSAEAQERKAYFGETHVHTSWSFDAYIFGNHHDRRRPTRYKYAKGETDQAPARLRHQDRHAARLDGRDRPLRICRHRRGWPTRRARRISKLPIAQAADRPATPADIQRIYLWLGDTMIDKQADQGAVVARGGRHGLEAEQRRSPTRPTSRASSRPSAPTSGRRRPTTATCTATSSSRTAPRCRSCRSQLDGLAGTRGPLELDGRPAQGRQRAAGDLAQRQPLRRPACIPTDVDSKGRPIDAAWAASRDRNERLTEIKQIKGAVGDPSAAVAERRVRQLRDPDAILLGDPAGPHPARSRAATCARP